MLKRFVLFKFPDYETAWLERCVVGDIDTLDSKLLDSDALQNYTYQALDIKTGDIMEYNWDGKVWKWEKEGNVN